MNTPFMAVVFLTGGVAPGQILAEDVIDKEDKTKPLSDQKLQKILEDKDIKISRRAIAKYREELKILPSHLRKS